MATDLDQGTDVCADGSGRVRILVIDDEPKVIDGIKRRLSRFNIDVLEGYHGFQGIWRGMTEQPDAIITDIKMPHADGEQVIECLQHNPGTQSAPIFVLTGLRDSDLEQRLLARGVQGYFTKPADWDALLAALQQALPEKSFS